MINTLFLRILLIGQTPGDAEAASCRGMMADTCAEVAWTSDAAGNRPAAAGD